MWSVVSAVTAFFDLLIGIFAGMHPVVGLSVVSILTGAVMLVVWKYTSNQDAIADAKTKIGAYILEIRLFQEDLGRQFAAQGKALRANLKYMSLAIPPLIVVLLPVVAILVQLDVRYQRRPFQPGESTMLRVVVAENVEPASVVFEAPEGIVAETPAMRIPREHEVSWRIRAEAEGDHELTFTSGGETVTKRIRVGDRLAKLAEGRDKAGILGVWMAPAEAPLPRSSAFESIEFTYPERGLTVGGVGMHWLLVFFVVSVAFGFAIKGWVGVEV